MMNVLTDILYDSSSLMPSQNFKETLSQNKILPPHDIAFEHKQLHQMNVSQMNNIDEPILSTSHSAIDLYDSSNQIHLSSNTNAAFEDENDVSVFSDSFPEIVPSWLTHDFMKVSDSLPSPDILPDMYPSTNESEHLEMLDLGFPSELSSQVVTRLDGTCISESQKLLEELPIQQYSNNDSLLMTSFNNVNITDLDPIQYQKVQQNPHQMPLLTPMLSCENSLIHLPLHSSLSDQCLTSSPMMSSSQSQSHPVNVACDKLPQINLNHLDSFLGGKAALSSIQVMHQDFPSSSISNELNCNQSSQSRINDCHPTTHATTHELLNRSVAPLSLTQDASIQVSENAFNDNYNFLLSQKCYSCSKVNSGDAIEVTQCFKCKFCDFISLHKCAIESHINSSHSKSSNINTAENTSPMSADGNLSIEKNHFQCTICNMLFSEVTAYKLHLLSVHNINPSPHGNNYIISVRYINSQNFRCEMCNKLFLDSASYNAHIISSHYVNLGPVHVSAQNGFANSNTNQIKVTNGVQCILPKDPGQTTKPANSKPRLLLKEPNNSTDSPPSKPSKPVSSHKKAWQRKMNRELGSYICEFKGCNIRFRALDNLEYHKKCHVSGGNSFACPECEMKFENWGTIAGHLWRNHKNDMELHACDQCQFRHYSLSHLEKTHKKIHLDECSFLCESCGKGFKNGKQMRNHRVYRCNTNPKKKPNRPKSTLEQKCKICSTHFASRVLLQHHEDMVHNVKRKSFMCNYCDYSSKKKGTLRLHMRQHTGEKPFECDQCDYRTSDHNSLRRHKRVHSGEKQYRCPFCPYSAIQASSYKEHMKKHPGHNGVMFSCEICSFKTIKRDTYILHVNDHQSISMIQNASSMNETSSTELMYPLADAMDISLSYGDNNNLIPQINKNMQSFFHCLGINMVSVCQESAT